MFTNNSNQNLSDSITNIHNAELYSGSNCNILHYNFQNVQTPANSLKTETFKRS